MARNKLKYRGRLYDRLSEAIVYRSVSLMYETLDPDTLQATVESEGREWLDFALDEPVVSYYQDRQDGVYYLQDVRQTAWNKYTIYATSTLGLLLKRPHKGGYYNGQGVEEVVRDICGPVPVYVKTVYQSIKLYGWLPYVKPPASSARDNLQQVLFAIGADLATDLDGVLRVEPLWDGVSGSIHGRMGVSTSLQRETSVTGVQVIEHQWLEGGDTITLFEGTAVQGQEITFSEPAYGLTATGFAILERGVNYAVLSAGTGTLTGRAYRHNTRTISRGIYSGNKENIVTIDSMTLVSLVNSADAAHRMLSYYTCRELVDTPYIYLGEEAGDRLVAYDPFSRTPVQACMESAEITLSNQLLAAAKLRVGYVPPQPETAEYYDTRKVLTGSGQFVVPEGVTTIRYVLVQGGQGGKAGKQGGESGPLESISFSHRPLSTVYNYSGYGPGPGGDGGLGGEPGHGGRVLEGELSVTPGQVIAWNCGIGGLGAVFDANNPDAEGQEGGHTTFGTASTANGSYTATGWTDVTTGETYGLPGLQGLPGAKGGGKIDGHVVNSLDTAYRAAPPESAVDEDGNTWPGGTTELKENGQLKYTGEDGMLGNIQAGFVTAQTSINIASGAAAGSPGLSSTGYGKAWVNNKGSSSMSGYAAPPAGLPGANAALVPHKASLTNGGRGGYGGGGGSSAGYALIGKVGSIPGTINGAAKGPGGNGGQGGQGGDGLIILFYSAKIELPSGALATADGWWFRDRLGRWFVV